MNVRSGRGIQHVAMSGGCITHLSRARQSYVDVEQSCVTGLDSCHACHGMRGAGARRLENVAEASVLVISSLMNIINLPFNEQEIFLCVHLVTQDSLPGGLWGDVFFPRSDTRQSPGSVTLYLLHIYNNWPLTPQSRSGSSQHGSCWLRLRLSPEITIGSVGVLRSAPGNWYSQIWGSGRQCF